MSAIKRVQQWATMTRTWHLFDAKWQNPFEAGQEVKKFLMGLHKPIYHPQNDCGDHVIVVNCRHVAMPGDEWRRRHYFHHNTYPGGATWTPAWELHNKDPTMVMWKAVYHSMKGNIQRRYTMQRLKLFAEEEMPPEVRARITSVIRQTRRVPQRLDHVTQSEDFPHIAVLPVDFVIPELKPVVAKKPKS